MRLSLARMGLETTTRQGILAREDDAVIVGGAVGARDHAVGGHVAVEPGEELGGAGGVAPVAHEVADDGEQRDDVDAGAQHLVVGDVADLFGRRAAGFEVGPDGVAFGAEGAGEEGGAWLKN